MAKPGYKTDRDSIKPDELYPLEVFRKAAGISDTTAWRLRKAGIVLATIDTGKKKFVEGRDGQEYIRRWGRWKREQQAAAADAS